MLKCHRSFFKGKINPLYTPVDVAGKDLAVGMGPEGCWNKVNDKQNFVLAKIENTKESGDDTPPPYAGGGW